MTQQRVEVLKDFSRAYTKGRWAQKGRIGVQYVDNGENRVRWGVGVSAKKWKRAVDRNKIKRTLRGVIRSLFPFINPGKDIIVVYIGNSREINEQDIQKELKEVLVRLNVYQLTK